LSAPVLGDEGSIISRTGALLDEARNTVEEKLDVAAEAIPWEQIRAEATIALTASQNVAGDLLNATTLLTSQAFVAGKDAAGNLINSTARLVAQEYSRVNWTDLSVKQQIALAEAKAASESALAAGEAAAMTAWDASLNTTQRVSTAAQDRWSLVDWDRAGAAFRDAGTHVQSAAGSALQAVQGKADVALVTEHGSLVLANLAEAFGEILHPVASADTTPSLLFASLLSASSRSTTAGIEPLIVLGVAVGVALVGTAARRRRVAWAML